MLRHRKNYCRDISATSLREMDESIAKFDKTFHKLVAPVMPSKGKTMKYHKLSHVTNSIRRLGNTREFDAQFYEASNKQQKISYNTTSKKTTNGKYLQEMADHQDIRQAICSTSTFDPDSNVLNRSSAYLKASKSGENAMAANTFIALPTDPIGMATATLRADKFMKSMSDYSEICESVRACFAGESPTVNVRRTAVLNATVTWLSDENELQTIRAAPLFHGSPYYDSVIFKMSQNRATKYGLVKLIFKARDPVSNSLLEKVCIQLYDKAPASVTDVLVKSGCISLKLSSSYEVIPLACLLQRIYVVPDFQRGNPHFHICRWKWNRSPIQDY